jgi:conjugal transfer mating pair stabilization protein TraG
MTYQVITYGDPEILKGIFDAIAMCLNSQSGSLFKPLMRLGLGVGSLWALAYSIWGDYMKALSGWLIPLFMITCLLLVPQSRVFIKNPAFVTSHQVDHVPFGLAMSASLISRIGHSMTENIEMIFTTVDDLKYHKTGFLFASNLVQQAKTFHITNEDLASNMREFVGHCVVYDAMLGRKYTIEDLRNSDDIWTLVSTQASPVRSFVWKEPHNVGESSARPEIITCREGVARFNRLWGVELDRTATLFGQKIFGKNGLINPKVALLQHMQSSYSFLVNSSKSALEILKQQMMIYAVVDGIEQKSVALGNAPNFAARRAYLQQRSTYETLGAMAGETLPTMKAVLEAIVYSAFLFIVPLSVLPFGWRFLSSWGQTLLWLQMWAPLYAILHYLILMTARSKSLAALSISSEAGVTLASSVGLVNANADLAAMAGYLAISIPFLAVALVKGVGSFVHMASHLGAVSQGAASMAAGEAVSGNYSFGNISEGNQQIANTNMLSHSTAASYKAGMFSQSDGRIDMVTTADGQQIVNVGSSSVPVSVNKAETESAVLTEQSSRSYQKAIQQSESAGMSMGKALKGLTEASYQEGHTENYSEQTSYGKSIEQSSAVSKIGQIVKDFAKNHNLSEEQAATVIGQASIGGKFLGVGGSISGSIDGRALDQKTINEAIKIGQDEQFQKTTKEAVQAVQNQSYTQNNEDSRRKSDSISQSWESAQSLRAEASKSFRESEDLQKQAAWIQSNASTINTNFTQQAIEGVANMPADNARGRIGMQGVTHMAAHNPELLQKYVSHWASHHGINVPASPELKGIESASDLERSYREERRHLQEQTPSHEFGGYQLQTPSETQEINSLETRHESPIPYKREIPYPEIKEPLLQGERGTHDLDTIGRAFSLQEQSSLSVGEEAFVYPKTYTDEKGSAERQTVLNDSSNYPLKTATQNQGQSFVEARSDNKIEPEREGSILHNNMALANGTEERALSNSSSISSERETPQQPVQRSSAGLASGESQTAHKTSASRPEMKPQNERPVSPNPIDKKPLGLDSEKIEKLKIEVSTMQRSTSEAIESSEKQHEQQRQGIEKEFHKKKNKNLLRVAAKAEVKNLADTALGMPYEGAKSLVKKLTGESQKKP